MVLEPPLLPSTPTSLLVLELALMSVYRPSRVVDTSTKWRGSVSAHTSVSLLADGAPGRRRKTCRGASGRGVSTTVPVAGALHKGAHTDRKRAQQLVDRGVEERLAAVVPLGGCDRTDAAFLDRADVAVGVHVVHKQRRQFVVVRRRDCEGWEVDQGGERGQRVRIRACGARGEAGGHAHLDGSRPARTQCC